MRWPLQTLQPVHQWIRSAIRDSQQPTLPVGFLFLKLLPLPCAVLLVSLWNLVFVDQWPSQTLPISTTKFWGIPGPSLRATGRPPRSALSNSSKALHNTLPGPGLSNRVLVSCMVLSQNPSQKNPRNPRIQDAPNHQLNSAWTHIVNYLLCHFYNHNSPKLWQFLPSRGKTRS